ncbi:hypothetical protein EIN_056490 [Entamoeba invadens IP1]|uniref:Axoneme-associated protein mst101 n=1 Tax=Entamoeba invadens TaxID=33085 RepID=S0B0W8_ENTIV|nr:hypothetical protein EIN_056490 [Entamoeba invadens IP1]ELP93274.1 hypothetical protein EIN_056490 [Entamoeba invadens IP1]BAN41183.1 hypothetical protein, conserved [Entamoeba invadens]BAN42037.1 hypothetical protein, conserved [Entamoeba invadens]|eukprot:XP_004260045.1 hypothetical protein EIN_056490 [Entamoeba invadens IP1]
MRAIVIGLLLLVLVHADEGATSSTVKSDPLYKEYKEAIKQVDVEARKEDSPKKEKMTEKKRAQMVKNAKRLARKLKKIQAKVAAVKLQKKMEKLYRQSMKQIKKNSNVKQIARELNKQLSAVAGKNKKAQKQLKKLIKRFDVVSKIKVAKIVKHLQNKLVKQEQKKSSLKIGPSEKKLAKKAIKYVKLANERMGKCEKYIELACKASPKHCAFFKKSFIVAKPIVV